MLNFITWKDMQTLWHTHATTRGQCGDLEVPIWHLLPAEKLPYVIPLFYSVAEQQWVQAPEQIKHCLLFAFHAVKFYCHWRTSASGTLCHALHMNAARWHVYSDSMSSRSHFTTKTAFSRCIKEAVQLMENKLKFMCFCVCLFLKTKLKTLKFLPVAVVLCLQVSIIVTITMMEAAGPVAE